MSEFVVMVANRKWAEEVIVAASSMAEAAHKVRKAEFRRTGERVRVVEVRRPTQQEREQTRRVN